MAGSALDIDRHVERWWFLFAVALFLLIPLDLFTTFLAITKHGTVVEANPVMRWLFEQGIVVVTVVNLFVAGLTVYMFHAALGRIRNAPPSYHSTLISVVHVWIAVLLVAGVVLTTNNLLVFV
jgi:hypothetical protein